MTVVLHVLEALEGGTARHVTDLVRHVGEVTHHVAVPEQRVGGVTDPLAVPDMVEAGAVVHRVDMRRRPVSPHNAAAVWSLRRLVRGLRPDVVHGHSSIGGALARAAAWDGRTRRIYTPNGLYPSAPAAAVERVFGTRTEHLVAVSDGEARLVAARGIVPEERIVVIPNGVDLVNPPPPGPDLRAILGIGPGAPLVGFVGRLVPQKAPEVLVEAAVLLRRRRPGAHVVIIGSGSGAEAVARLVRRRGLSASVHLLPYQPGAAGMMGQFDVFALPSLYEGGPYTPLEAMRAGTPVVLSDVVGNRDVVRHGHTGLLFPVGDAGSLAAAIELLIEDADLRSRLTRAAGARLAERFDVRASAAAMARLYLHRPPG